MICQKTGFWACHEDTEQCFLEIGPGALTVVEAAIQQAACEANAESLNPAARRLDRSCRSR